MHTTERSLRASRLGFVPDSTKLVESELRKEITFENANITNESLILDRKNMITLFQIGLRPLQHTQNHLRPNVNSLHATVSAQPPAKQGHRHFAGRGIGHISFRYAPQTGPSTSSPIQQRIKLCLLTQKQNSKKGGRKGGASITALHRSAPKEVFSLSWLVARGGHEEAGQSAYDRDLWCIFRCSIRRISTITRTILSESRLDECSVSVSTTSRTGVRLAPLPGPSITPAQTWWQRAGGGG